MANDQLSMTNECSNSNDHGFDLEERTAQFGEAVIRFARSVSLDAVTDSLVRQLVRSATSIGANYGEANESESKKDFRHKIGICRKEAKETRHWLRMVAVAHEPSRNASRELWKEAKELNLIFASIFRNTRV